MCDGSLRPRLDRHIAIFLILRLRHIRPHLFYRLILKLIKI